MIFYTTLDRLIHRLTNTLKRHPNVLVRLGCALGLLVLYICFGIVNAVLVIFTSPQTSFQLLNKIDQHQGYLHSYSTHSTWKRSLQLSAAASTVLVILITVFNGLFATPQAVYGVDYTVTCSGGVSTPTAITESTYTASDTLTLAASGSAYCVLDEPLVIGTLTLQTGVRLMHATEDTDGINITAANIDIQGTATILVYTSSTSVNGCGGGSGGANGEGPNITTGVCTITTSGYGDGVASGYGGGGAHGGAGGQSSDGVTSTTYGSNTAPTLLGSGAGAAGSGDGGGDGGGKAYLEVSNTLTVTGTISANGGDGGAGTATGGGGGGGSGGAIYVITKTLAGAGSITANAGKGGNNTDNTKDGSGGGGGRVAIYYDTSTYTGSITANKGVKGSGSTGGVDGSDGTTYTLQCTVPSTPSITSPADAATGVSRNPSLTSSTYSTNCLVRPHLNSDWKVTSDSAGNTLVWSKDNDTSNLASITVNTTNGTFSGALSGATKLAGNTTYYVFVRHNNQLGDSAWSASSSFTTTNAAPTFSGTIPNQTTNEDTNLTNAFDLDTYFSDSDGDTITYSATNGFLSSLGTMTINANGTVDFTVVANANGSDTVQFRATDPYSATADSNTVTITLTAVNDTPSFTKGANQTVNEDAGAQTVSGWATNISAGPSDESAQTLTFTVTNNNNSLFSTQPAVNSSTGNLTYTPASNANGSATVTVTLADNGGTANSGSDTSAAQTFTITVTAVNDSPIFTGTISNQSSPAGATISSAFDLDTYFSDVDDSTLTYTATNGLAANLGTMTINSNGTVTFIFASNTSGTDTIQFKATDAASATADSNLITVTVTSTNAAPTANAGQDRTVSEDDGTVTLDGSSSTDPDGNTLTYTWTETVDSSDGCSLSGTTLSQPTVTVLNKSSNYSCEYRLTVSDGLLSSSDTIALTVTADNDAPAFSAGTITATVNAGDTVNYVVAASDADTSLVTLAAEDSDDSFADKNINLKSLFTDNQNNTGTFNWATTTTNVGNYEITFTANDGASTVNQQLNLTVNSIAFSGSLPNIAMIADSTTTAVFDLDDYFSDPTDSTMAYSLSDDSALIITIKKGIVTMTAPADSEGTYELTFVATNDAGVTATSNSIIVTVMPKLTESDISYLKGNNEGAGRITVVDDSGTAIASWRAFAEGGAIPRLATVNNTVYVFVVKRKAGSTLHAYSTYGDVIKKVRLSPKLHWRSLAVGDVDDQPNSEEIVVATRRDSAIYFKVYSFKPADQKFVLRDRSAYQGVVTNNYRIAIKSGKIQLYSRGDKLLIEWQPTLTD